MISSKAFLTLLFVSLSCTGFESASANIINIMPSKDNTLYEYDPAEGDHSNGAGFHFFAGENAMGEIRRGVLAFDIAGTIPPGSTITAVSLSMNMSMTPTGAVTVELHKLLADWGEGTSHAPMGEGAGAQARADEGFASAARDPSSGALRAPPSPARGEGRNQSTISATADDC